MPFDPSPAAFWDRMAERYAARALSDPRAYERMLARVIAHLPAEARALEIGCGTGMTAARLAPHVGQLTASDISAGMLSIAARRMSEGGIDNVALVRGAIGDAALDKGPWEAVLAFSLLHLLPKPEDTVRQVHDGLRPGGVFISKTVCLGARWYLWPVVRVLSATGTLPAIRVLTPARLEAMIAEAGFEIVETGDFPSRALGRFVVARKPG